jgi:hypothetical protein
MFTITVYRCYNSYYDSLPLSICDIDFYNFHDTVIVNMNSLVANVVKHPWFTDFPDNLDGFFPASLTFAGQGKGGAYWVKQVPDAPL